MTVTPLEKEAEPILINGLTWREFKIVAQLIASPGIRLSYLDGVLEIQKLPGRQHETIKERIGAFLEIYLEFLGLDFTPTGSITLVSESEQVKREADKSYELSPDRERADLAIEVVVSSGGIDILHPSPFFPSLRPNSYTPQPIQASIPILMAQLLPKPTSTAQLHTAPMNKKGIILKIEA